MTIMDDIDQLLAELQTPEPVVNNILDEPISEAVKGRPLLPRKYRPYSPSPQGQGEEKEGHSRRSLTQRPYLNPFEQSRTTKRRS